MLLYVHWFSVNLKEYTKIAVKVLNNKYFVIFVTFAFTYKLSGCLLLTLSTVDTSFVVVLQWLCCISNIHTMVFTKEVTKF